MPKDLQAKLMSNVSLTFKTLYSPLQKENGVYKLKPVPLPPSKKRSTQSKQAASYTNLQAKMRLHDF